MGRARLILERKSFVSTLAALRFRAYLDGVVMARRRPAGLRFLRFRQQSRNALRAFFDIGG